MNTIFSSMSLPGISHRHFLTAKDVVAAATCLAQRQLLRNGCGIAYTVAHGTSAAKLPEHIVPATAIY